MSNSTAVAKAGDNNGIAELLSRENVRTRIEPYLMPGASLERVIAGARFAARQNPAILQCTPASIVDAVSRIQQWGLEIGVTAHLVPFGKVCTPIADYKGYAELMVRSGAVRHVEARVVYEKDTFSYAYGLDPYLNHIPVSCEQRGKISHAYVVLRLPHNRSSFEVMPIQDIDAIRKKNSKQWKEGECPAWYAKKTVVRQAAKLIPKDPRLASVLRVVDEDEAQEFGEGKILPEVLPPGSARGEPDEEFTNLNSEANYPSEGLTYDDVLGGEE